MAEATAAHVLQTVSCDTAYDLFVQPGSHCTLRFPDFIDFAPGLAASTRLLGKDGFLSRRELAAAKRCAGANRLLFAIDEEGLGVDEFPVINPHLHVGFTNVITQPENWRLLQDRFGSLAKESDVECRSFPDLASLAGRRQIRLRIRDQLRLRARLGRLGMRHKCMHVARLGDFFASLCTHVAAWALVGKDAARTNLDDRGLLSNQVDEFLRAFFGGLSKGLPSNSLPALVVAELVWLYVDVLLSRALRRLWPDADRRPRCHVVRYCDEYRILTNDEEVGDRIRAELVKVLAPLRLRLDPARSEVHHDIPLSLSLPRLDAPDPAALQSDPYQCFVDLYRESRAAPNSDRLVLTLARYALLVWEHRSCFGPKLELAGILTHIVARNQRAIPEYATVMMAMLRFMEPGERGRALADIKARLGRLPSFEYLSLWLLPWLVLDGAGADGGMDAEVIARMAALAGKATARVRSLDFSWIRQPHAEALARLGLVDEGKLAAACRELLGGAGGQA